MPVGVHGGHDVNVGTVNQLGDPVKLAVVVQEILRGGNEAGMSGIPARKTRITAALCALRVPGSG